MGGKRITLECVVEFLKIPNFARTPGPTLFSDSFFQNLSHPKTCNSLKQNQEEQKQEQASGRSTTEGETDLKELTLRHSLTLADW